MAISRRGMYERPAKSPWSFERYDSDLERRMMVALDEDPEVLHWVKRHNISIPWIDERGRQHQYHPDFLVEYTDGRKTLIEVKNPELMEAPSVQRKRQAAERWCGKRSMTYKMMTIE